MVDAFDELHPGLLRLPRFIASANTGLVASDEYWTGGTTQLDALAPADSLSVAAVVRLVTTGRSFMSEMGMATERTFDRVALGALVAGLAALVIFIIAPFTSDALWPIGILLAVVGGALGWFALRRTRRGERSRTMAIGGLGASAIVIVWFLIFLIVSAFD
jgi:hypothetical protein